MIYPGLFVYKNSLVVVCTCVTNSVNLNVNVDVVLQANYSSDLSFSHHLHCGSFPSLI